VTRGANEELGERIFHSDVRCLPALRIRGNAQFSSIDSNPKLLWETFSTKLMVGHPGSLPTVISGQSHSAHVTVSDELWPRERPAFIVGVGKINPQNGAQLESVERALGRVAPQETPQSGASCVMAGTRGSRLFR
jgi:hypothetical protein